MQTRADAICPRKTFRAMGSATSAAAATAHAAAGTCASTGAARAAAGQDGFRLHRDQAFALSLFAGELAGAADGLGLLAGAPLGGLFVVTTEFHFAEDAFALHLLFQRLERLVDIVVANE